MLQSQLSVGCSDIERDRDGALFVDPDRVCSDVMVPAEPETVNDSVGTVFVICSSTDAVTAGSCVFVGVRPEMVPITLLDFDSVSAQGSTCCPARRHHL